MMRYTFLSLSSIRGLTLTRVVPGSNARMLEKSLSLDADSICYDLEDSVSSKKKGEARRAVSALLDVSVRSLLG